MSAIETPVRPSGVGPPPRRPRHRARWVAGGLLVVLVTVAVVAATRPSVQATPFQSPLLGHRAPAISATGLDGNRVDLGDFRGRWVVVNFFASWCPPCGQEEPDLVAFAFHQQRSRGGALLLSVVFHDSDAAARTFLATTGARWPAASDPGGAIANAYGVASPPTTFLINPEGVVAQAFAGPLTAQQLDNALAAARR